VRHRGRGGVERSRGRRLPVHDENVLGVVVHPATPDVEWVGRSFEIDPAETETALRIVEGLEPAGRPGLDRLGGDLGCAGAWCGQQRRAHAVEPFVRPIDVRLLDRKLRMGHHTESRSSSEPMRPRVRATAVASPPVSDDSISPIRHDYLLRCSAEHAFATYTGRIGEWWDPRYTAKAETLKAVTIEPRVGGRVYATHRDTGDDDWGEVRIWEPGRRLVHTFALAQDARHPSEVAVEFVPRGGAENGCTVRFFHGGWTDANAALRKKFSDWPVMLDRFAALADSNS
jgi:Activator of Hsp90 ATPase homolog 1-like protein